MIKIEDLDEFEGLTADMVRAWLRAKGWRRKESAAWIVWGAPCGTMAVPDKALTAAAVETLSCIAAHARLSVQSLLREMNPRMRAGWPTEDEIKAHDQRGGLWIAQSGDAAMQFGRFGTKDGRRTFLDDAYETWWFADECGRWSFWPCDQHGNKTRRGA